MERKPAHCAGTRSVVVPHRGHTRFCRVRDLLQALAHRAGLPEHLLCSTDSQGRNAKYARDYEGSKNHAWGGWARRRFCRHRNTSCRNCPLRGQGRAGFELEKPDGLLFLHRVRSLHGGLSGQYYGQETIAPQDHDGHPRPPGRRGPQYASQQRRVRGRWQKSAGRLYFGRGNSGLHDLQRLCAGMPDTD